MRCASGKHEWLDKECAKRCCNGYTRVSGPDRRELEREGAEYVTMRRGDNMGWFDGWLPSTDLAAGGKP